MSDLPSRPVAIVNPNSANGRTGRSWPRIEAAIRTVLPQVEARFTERPGHATELVREALEAGADEILSVGGDGTNNEVINGFFDGERPISPEAVLAIVPSGTGGDFRRTLGMAKDPAEVVHLFRKGRVIDADVGWLTCEALDGRPLRRLFINITSFGIGGLVDQMVNQTSKALGGKASFMWGSVKAFARYRKQPMRVFVDDELVYEGPVFNAATCNGQYFGGGMWVAPMADPTDGRLELVLLGNLSTPSFLALTRRIYDGRHLGSREVWHFSGQRVRAETSGEALIDMDGEVPGRLPIELGLLPGAVRLRSVVDPAAARADLEDAGG
jgi:diacylglycerol kinase (ATP)